MEYWQPMDVLETYVGVSKETFINHFASFFSTVQEPYLILLFGVLAGFLSSLLVQALCKLHIFLRQFSLLLIHRCWTFLLDSLAFLRCLWLTQILPSLCHACSWKTYKKVMPWRRACSPADSPVNVESTLTTKDDLFGSESDLEFFKARTMEESLEWKSICEKNLGEYLKYDAYMRVTQGNKTEYKSTTIIRNATAEEMTDFYLDDESRRQWDSLLARCEPVECGPARYRCEVVRWIRSFPFPFLSDREYVIGRRIFKKGDVIYTISKGISHDNVPIKPSVVRMDVYYSMWSCKTIACPWGSEKPACEVVLLHHEQFKIPERLARFAVVRGMGGFVRQMGPAMVTFVENQREMKSLNPVDKFPHASSEYSLVSSSDGVNTIDQPLSGESKGKLKKTIKRAILATLAGTAVFMIRKATNGQKLSP